MLLASIPRAAGLPCIYSSPVSGVDEDVNVPIHIRMMVPKSNAGVNRLSVCPQQDILGAERAARRSQFDVVSRLAGRGVELVQQQRRRNDCVLVLGGATPRGVDDSKLGVESSLVH